MASYGVLTKDAPIGMELVREGFSFSAFLFGPLWFAGSRAWLGATVWIIGAASIAALSVAFAAGAGALLMAIVTFMFLMGLEASEFRRRSLIRRGYRLADIVEAHDRNEAQVRFLARRFSAPAAGGPPNPHPRLSPHRAETVGLFLNGT